MMPDKLYCSRFRTGAAEKKQTTTTWVLSTVLRQGTLTRPIWAWRTSHASRTKQARCFSQTNPKQLSRERAKDQAAHLAGCRRRWCANRCAQTSLLQSDRQMLDVRRVFHSALFGFLYKGLRCVNCWRKPRREIHDLDASTDLQVVRISPPPPSPTRIHTLRLVPSTNASPSHPRNSHTKRSAAI